MPSEGTRPRGAGYYLDKFLPDPPTEQEGERPEYERYKRQGFHDQPALVIGERDQALARVRELEEHAEKYHRDLDDHVAARLEAQNEATAALAALQELVEALGDPQNNERRKAALAKARVLLDKEPDDAK